MSFYPEPSPVPELLKTAVFTLRPLTPAHVQLDYAALMSNIELLRLWGGHNWPTADFTLADNLQDLAWHDREHRKRIAFTYSVLSAAEDQCLGCVYINPLTKVLPGNETVLADVPSQTPIVRFWVIQSQIDNKLDSQLLESLIAWFKMEWDFSLVLYHTRKANEQQIHLLGDRLRHLYTLQLPNRGGTNFCYGT
ncbi:MAG: hypothetical protein KDE48_05520 [Anaerolineales bacterium]|nr:hypothetical protein [Anaerolineales bacterium]